MAPKGFDPLSSKDVELEKTLATFVASSLKINTSDKWPRLWYLITFVAPPVYAEIFENTSLFTTVLLTCQFIYVK